MSGMVLEFYGLREQPFGVSPNPRYLYPSPSHREALASLICGLENGAGFSTLIAEPGTGKTTLLLDMVNAYRGVAPIANIFNTQCNGRELLSQIAEELGLDALNKDFVHLHAALKRFLAEHTAPTPVLIVIDEAQNLDESALETVRLLSNFELPEYKLLHIVLAGQTQLAYKLSSPKLTQLKQRITVMARLRRLQPADTARYVAHRLKCAGYTGPPLFSAGALAGIAEATDGIPRLINQTCFNALILGSSKRAYTIGEDIIREVAADLELKNAATGESLRPTAARVEATKPLDRLVSSKPRTDERRLESQPLEVISRKAPPRAESSKQIHLPVAGTEKRVTSVPGTRNQAVGLAAAAARSGHAPDARTDASTARTLALTKHEQQAFDTQLWSGTASNSRKYPIAAVACLLGALPIAGLVWREAKTTSTSPAHVAISTASVERQATPADSTPVRDEGERTQTAVSAASPVDAPTSPVRTERQRDRSSQARAAGVVQPIQVLSSRGPLKSGEPVDPPVLQFDEARLSTAVTTEAPPLPTLATFQGERAGRTLSGGELMVSPKPKYPSTAVFLQKQGTVVLRVQVGPDGTVTNVTPVTGDKMLTDAAMAAVWQWRYRPYLVDGRAMQMETTATIHFALPNTDNVARTSR